MNINLVEKIIEESIEKGVYEKQICVNYGITPGTLSYYKKKYNLSYRKGKHPNSKGKRIYNVDDNYFSEINSDTCYWAGFIAADGNINKKMNSLTIALSSKDESHLEKFLKCLNSNYKINRYLSNGFPTSYITIQSKKMCNDLFLNFNITPKKSYTLRHPNILNKEFIDSFIIGYIDGDGTIGLTKGKRQMRAYISIIGTYEICTWIDNRFREILNKVKNGNPYNERNIFSVKYADKNARNLIVHFNKSYRHKLSRKWSEELLKHCFQFKKFENINKYHQILELDLKGLSNKEICTKLKISNSLLYFYKNRETYLKMKNLKINEN